MPTFTFRGTRAMREIAAEKIQRIEADRPIFRHMPVRPANTFYLEWTQRDNWTGLQQIRGLNGEPAVVKRQGERGFITYPGAYGEFMNLDEMELTIRAAQGSEDAPIPVDDLIGECQDQLLGREYDRIEYIDWQLLVNGTFSVVHKNGTIAHKDTFALQTFTATPSWATRATATPILDLLDLQLLARGKSTSFGPQAELWFNLITWQNLLLNENAADIGGKLNALTGGGQIPGPALVSTILQSFNLPSIVVYDEGYLNDAGTFTLFIPDNVGVLIGRRPNGDDLGEYRMTRNVNNPGGAPGSYEKVINRTADKVPPNIEVHRGHNGGPVIFYPGSFVRCTL